MSALRINALLNAKQFYEAFLAIEAALAAEPENGYFWNRRGIVIQLLDHADGPPLSEVERSHLKALEINPRDLDALEELAHYYDIENKPGLAKKLCERVFTNRSKVVRRNARNRWGKL